jgi:hypothetical protein
MHLEAESVVELASVWCRSEHSHRAASLSRFPKSGLRERASDPTASLVLENCDGCEHDDVFGEESCTHSHRLISAERDVEASRTRVDITEA